MEVMKNWGLFNSKRVAVVDQGEKTVWYSIHKNGLNSHSYYVHAHMSNSYIHLKLSEVVDIPGSQNGSRKQSIISIKETSIAIEDVYEQVTKLLWCHLKLINEEERENFIHGDETRFIGFMNTFDVFGEKLKNFIKKEVSIGHIIDNTFCLYS